MTHPTGPAHASKALLKRVRSLRLAKHRESTFLAEGPQAVGEALAAGAVERLFVVDDDTRHDVETWQVTREEMAALATTVQPQPILAECRTPALSWSDADPIDWRLVVIAAQIRDPGNLGTLIRTADAFGADAVIVTPHSVDVTNPKVVRASVGSIFHLPIIVDADLAEVAAALRDAGLRIVAADVGGTPLTDADLSAPTAWLMGNEAWGLPAADRARADVTIAIDMWPSHSQPGRPVAESLNLATAAAVCLFATAAAQRGRHR